ncbi:MAG TPA: molybdopterin molybdotransferase MoeA [Candidatus Cybelea sp.]|jgi:molybdenum cofactor synthesis domain-containing protein|nr:molybdopterin molybdotransferase MoeA [Candidatus Cybelea sp.]
MEKRAIMQSANPLLPNVGFVPERLLAPRQAIVAYLSRVAVAPPGTEHVALDGAFGRVLAQPVAADHDYPGAARSAMDGFALQSRFTPGSFAIVDGVAMGTAPTGALEDAAAMRIPTGGLLPSGADAVVPIEETRAESGRVCVDAKIESGENVIPRGADMRRGEPLLAKGRRLRAADIGLLATLGITQVPVYRRPRIAVISSGDELIDPSQQPRDGEIRDSNRYAIAASLRAMGAAPAHYPTLRDDAEPFIASLAPPIAECDAVVLSGGSSVGERDRLPDAVARAADPGIVVHGLRVKPGKPTLLGAAGNKPILGLPGNPVSALFILEAVAAPIVAALVGAPVEPGSVSARLEAEVKGRPGWTWFVPVALRHEGDAVLAHPFGMRSFSVSLGVRADGYVIVDERDEMLPAGAIATVYRFLGG